MFISRLSVSEFVLNPHLTVLGVVIEKNIQTHEVEINQQTRRDLIVEFTALGTAIVASGSDTLAIDYALPLSG